MKKQVNRNIVWSELFFRQLAHSGVKHICLCPGSRNTPLIFGVTNTKKFKLYNHVDERSAAFFALGIAKNTKEPVAVITTSGTAVPELYPAIVEAYFTRTPLIICTADRPPELQHCGSSQTINQKNIFDNHIRYFLETGTPDFKRKNINKLLTLTKKAIEIATIRDRGPVHINLPFRKPFEPDNYTDELSPEEMKFIDEEIRFKSFSVANSENIISNKIVKEINDSSSGLILFTIKNPSQELEKLVLRLSSKLNYAIIEDGTSGIRFTEKNKISSTSNFSSITRSKLNLDPEIILQFGDAPISNSLLNFFEKSKAKKLLINDYGDILDPSKTYSTIIKANPEAFCKELLPNTTKSKTRKKYFDLITNIDYGVEENKHSFMNSAPFQFEGKVISETVKALPDNSNVMISNSTPVRDFDIFTLKSGQQLNVFTNRGAAGIDGITSTALGISTTSKKPTVLITGDLAFYYDMNGLLAAYNYDIPLLVILINNNGGGIFEMLPVSRYKKVFEQNFKTPTNLNYENFVKGYGGNFHSVTTLKEFTERITEAIKQNDLSVIEVKTDSKQSSDLRIEFKNRVLERISEIADDYQG